VVGERSFGGADDPGLEPRQVVRVHRGLSARRLVCIDSIVQHFDALPPSMLGTTLPLPVGVADLTSTGLPGGTP